MDVPAIRLLTINIHKGFSWFNTRFVLRKLRSAIRATSADIVFLQEVTGRHAKKARKHVDWPREAHYEFLADSVWTDFAYGKNAVYPAGHHGNAILSRFPIVDHEKVDISTNRLEQRGFLFCRIEIPGHPVPLYCFCVHLSLFGVSRKKQLAKLRNFIRERVSSGAPVIIAGDFNDWQGRGSRYLAEPLRLKEAFLEFKGKEARTFPAWLPLLRLDRLYVRGLHVRDVKTYYKGNWRNLTDHVALFSEVTLDHRILQNVTG